MRTSITLAFAALSIVATAIPADAANRVRRECRASGATDISMSARYEVRGRTADGRRKFSVEFEAAPGVGFAEGRRIVIRVDGVNVGSVRLEEVVGGDLVGDFNLDTRPQEDSQPFPGNFPANVGRGTEVSVVRGGDPILTCSLR